MRGNVEIPWDSSNAFSCLAAFVQLILTCWLKDNLWSRKTPNMLTCGSGFKVMSSIHSDMLGLSIFLDYNNINWNFDGVWISDQEWVLLNIFLDSTNFVFHLLRITFIFDRHPCSWANRAHYEIRRLNFSYCLQSLVPCNWLARGRGYTIIRNNIDCAYTLLR